MPDPKPTVYLHTTRVQKRSCPACRAPLDAATSMSMDLADQTPTPVDGDITCCASCGAILTMAGLSWQFATDDDVNRIEPDLKAILFQFSSQIRRNEPQ
jgi:hypothetical protein